MKRFYMHSNSTRAKFINRMPCCMRKYLRKKEKQNETYKKIKTKVEKNKKQINKLKKIWWDTIARRSFGNQTRDPLSHP